MLNDVAVDLSEDQARLGRGGRSICSITAHGVLKALLGWPSYCRARDPSCDQSHQGVFFLVEPV